MDVIRERAQHRPEQPLYTFFVDGDTRECRLIYGEIEQRARAIGANLQRHVLCRRLGSACRAGDKREGRAVTVGRRTYPGNGLLGKHSHPGPAPGARFHPRAVAIGLVRSRFLFSAGRAAHSSPRRLFGTGKYAERVAEATHVVVLDPRLAKAFPK